MPRGYEVVAEILRWHLCTGQMKATLNLSGKVAAAVNLVDDEVNSPAPMVKTAVGAKVCGRMR